MAKSKTGTKSKIQKPPPASASAPPVAEKKQPDVVDDAPQDGFGGLGRLLADDDWGGVQKDVIDRERGGDEGREDRRDRRQEESTSNAGWESPASPQKQSRTETLPTHTISASEAAARHDAKKGAKKSASGTKGVSWQDGSGDSSEELWADVTPRDQNHGAWDDRGGARSSWERGRDTRGANTWGESGGRGSEWDDGGHKSGGLDHVGGDWNNDHANSRGRTGGSSRNEPAGSSHHSHAAKASWMSWGEEAKRLPKVTVNTTPGSVGTRNVLSPQQLSQNLGTSLNQPNQTYSTRKHSSSTAWDYPQNKTHSSWGPSHSNEYAANGHARMESIYRNEYSSKNGYANGGYGKSNEQNKKQSQHEQQQGGKHGNKNKQKEQEQPRGSRKDSSESWGRGWGNYGGEYGRNNWAKDGGKNWGNDGGNWGNDGGSNWGNDGGSNDGGNNWGYDEGNDEGNDRENNWGHDGGNDWGNDDSNNWGYDGGGSGRNDGGNARGNDWGDGVGNDWNNSGNDWGNSPGNDWGYNAGNDRGNDWGDSSGKEWGSTTKHEESNDDTWNHKGRLSSKKNKSHASSPSWSMPSKTTAHANSTKSLPPVSYDSPLRHVRFVESKGAALEPVQQALFGKTRLSKDRIHWMFPSDKDDRVASLLSWIESVSYNLGSFGLQKFLQSRERGALLANATFPSPKSANEQSLDWLTFDQLQPTMDRTLQESVASYDPAVQVLIFVFLPSKSGRSIAMWRRKIDVPDHLRLTYQREITLALDGLRREDEYIVHIDETLLSRRVSLMESKSLKRKRKWWHIFG